MEHLLHVYQVNFKFLQNLLDGLRQYVQKQNKTQHISAFETFYQMF